MKRVLAWSLTVLVMLGLAGCGKEKAPALTMGTGGMAGIYYSYGGVVGQLIEDHTGMDVTVVETQGSRENILGMGSGDFQMALVQSDVLSYAWQGRRDFDGARVDNMRVVAGLYAEPIQLVAVNPEIHYADELRGMKVSVGTPGSGVYYNAMDILDAVSLGLEDFVPQYLDVEQTIEALEAGTIDAAFLVAGCPTPALKALSSKADFRLLPIDGPIAERVTTSCSFYAPHTIPAGTYQNQLSDVDTLAVRATLVVSADLPSDQVYAITQAVFGNRDAIRSCNPMGQQLTPETVAQGLTIPFHPGAEQYYNQDDISLKNR